MSEVLGFDPNQSTSEQQRSLEILTGEEVAKIVTDLYEQVGPHIGCRLIEPTSVLTIAGLKAGADLPFAIIDNDDINRVERIHLPTGIDLQARTAKPDETRHGYKHGQIFLINRDRYAQAERELPIITERATKQLGSLSEDDSSIIFQGTFLGYPAQAIIDFVAAYQNDTMDKLDVADILPKEYQKYSGALPQVCFWPQHKDDPEIQQYVRQSQDVLNAFYESEAFRHIEADPGFIEARVQSEKKWQKSLKERDIQQANER